MSYNIQNQMPLQQNKTQVKETQHSLIKNSYVQLYFIFIQPIFISLYHYIIKTMLQKGMKIIAEELIHALCLVIQYKLFSCNTLQETVTVPID